MDSTNLTDQILYYLQNAPASHFLGRVVEMGEQWSGADNLLWQVNCGGQEAVLKLFLDAGQARGRRQLDGQQLFAPYGLAPHPLWFDRYPEGLSRQVLIYTWLPGAAIDPGAPAQRAALVQAVAQIHGGDASAVRRFSPHPVNLDFFWRVLRGGLPTIHTWLLQKQAATLAQTVTQLAEEASALVTAALPLWERTPPTPVHGDLRLENCLHSLGASVLVDWEMFGLGDPALEVASFLHASHALLTGEQQAAWLEAYFACFDQPGLAQRVAVYQRLLPLQDLCYLLNGLRQVQNGNPPGWGEESAFLQATLTATLQQALAQGTVTLGSEQTERAVTVLFDATT